MVSIAIPAYKIDFLEDAINSALSQDYKDIELIIVNDGSPYDVNSIVSKFSDDRIRYYVNERNLGKESIVLNWNKCLEYAEGEYFVLLCDDDLLKVNFVSELVKLADKYPSCNVFHARKINRFCDGTERESSLWPEFEDFDSFLKNSFSNSRRHTITEFLYRTSYIKDKGGYVPYPTGFYSDTVSILEFCKTGGIASSSDPLCVFRFSDKNISSNKDNSQADGKAKATFLYLDWLKQFPESIKFRKEINEDVEPVFFIAYKGMSFFNGIQLLLRIPNNVVTFKHKLGFIISSFHRS